MVATNGSSTPSRLLTPEQTADRLQISVTTLATWRCRKSVALPFVKLGSAVRYQESAVAAFIEQQTVGAVAAA